MKDSFFSAARKWLENEPRIVAAVHFGSTAGGQMLEARGQNPGIRHPASGISSDFDVHTIVIDPAGMEKIDWSAALPGCGFTLQALRPATGGVRKLTALFKTGEIDLVLVPEDRAKQVRAAMAKGAHKSEGDLRTALNELATCLCNGYEILKGEAEWGDFYRQTLADLPGVRLSDAEIHELAAIFLSDVSWIRQKLDRGELLAAQHRLHTSLSAVNFRLLRELRLRRGEPLPSFGLARRFERIVPPAELEWVSVSARLDRAELAAATDTLLRGFQSLVSVLVPAYRLPLAAYRSRASDK